MTIAISTNTIQVPNYLREVLNNYNRLTLKIQDVRARRKSYLATKFELSVLSDRELADIGIPRSAINRLAKEEAMKVRTNEAL